MELQAQTHFPVVAFETPLGIIPARRRAFEKKRGHPETGFGAVHRLPRISGKPAGILSASDSVVNGSPVWNEVGKAQDKSEVPADSGG
jgi:hypothetical protein